MNKTHLAIIALCVALLVVVGLVTHAASLSPSEQTTSTPSSVDTLSATSNTASPRRIIIDTDTGGDDASALILAAVCPDVQIEGVTVLAGNVDLDQAGQNALAALEVAGCDAPVYKGSDSTLDGKKRDTFSIFGTDGMGDADLVHPTGIVQSENAIDFILDSVRAHPDEIEIVALGPATNIAKAIELDPEAMSHVKMIWSMGTAGLGAGNASPVAEFNVYADAPAYQVLLDSGVPVTIVGLDVCGGDALWTSAQFDELEQTNEVGSFVVRAFTKIREFFRDNRSGRDVDNCDGLAMMCALYPGFVNETIRCHASCVTDECEAYALVLFYQEGYEYDGVFDELPYDDFLVTDVDADRFFDSYKAAIESFG